MLLTVSTCAGVITGFNSPYDVAISPNHDYFYVTNNGNNTVSIVNKANNAIIGTITGFDRPEGIAFTPNGAFAYVANLGTNELIRIDATTNAITEITSGFNRPYFVSISPNGNTAYVTNQGNNTVSIVDLTSQPPLSTPMITPNSAVYDTSQNIHFTSTWSGGALPYIGNWVISQGASVVYSARYTGLNTLSNTLSLPASTLGIGNYAVNITVSDGSNAPQTANSVKSTFSISAAPSSCFISANTTAIDFGIVAPGTTSAFSPVTFSDTSGNTDSIITIYGTNWLYASNSMFGFAVGHTLWNSDATLPGTALTLSPGASTGINLPGHGNADVFLAVSIPNAQATDTYSQTITATTSC